VISPQAKYLDRARAWIHRLDTRAQGNEKQFFSYRVQNRPAKELLQIIASMFGSSGSGRGNNVAPRFGQASLSSDGSGSSSTSGGERPADRRRRWRRRAWVFRRTWRSGRRT
jgi:general secretion pathway protein D